MRWLFWLPQLGPRMWTVRGLVRRPWGGRGYAVAESGLWRWRESRVDRAIAALVRSGRRPPMNSNDMDHLLHFVARSALRGLREQDLQHVTDAIGALSYLDSEELDGRDASVAAYLALCVAIQLGMPAQDAFDAIARANPSVAETLVDDEDHEGGVYLDNLRNLSGDRIVRTPVGPVLVADISTDEHPYRPDTDLIGLALRLGEALQSRGTHVVDVCVLSSTLPAAFAAARAGIAGRVTVEAVSITLRGPSDVHIDLIEAATPEDAATIAAEARAAMSVHHGRLVGLIEARNPRPYGRLVSALLATASPPPRHRP